MELNSHTISEYLGMLPERIRDDVLESVLKTKMMQQALDTTEGRAILMECANGITEKILGILSAVRDKKDDEKARKIMEYATEINIMREFMVRCANIISQGEQHVKTMNERRKTV